MAVINCRKYADSILNQVKGKKGKLAIIQVGKESRSSVYVKDKVNDCKKVGIGCEVFQLPLNVYNVEVENLINKLNRDPEITGIIIQLPLPQWLNQDHLCLQIAPEKDVDGFGPLSPFNPCTPEGIVWLLRQIHGSLSGAEAVIVGRGKLVGAPLQKMLLDQNMTVTSCHSRTRNLRSHTRRADIVVLATGKHIFDDKYFRSSEEYRYIVGVDPYFPQTVIDAGITFDSNGKLCGDLVMERIDSSDMAVTPVPEGVGLLTRAVLVAHVAGIALI